VEAGRRSLEAELATITGARGALREVRFRMSLYFRRLDIRAAGFTLTGTIRSRAISAA